MALSSFAKGICLILRPDPHGSALFLKPDPGPDPHWSEKLDPYPDPKMSKLKSLED